MRNEKDIQLDIASRHSMIHLGSLDSFDITEGGKSAGHKILEYLENGNRDLLMEAIHIYEELIPNENFGGEYTALEWLCRYWTAPPEIQKEFLTLPMVESFYELLAKDDFFNLKWYLNRKYHFVEIDRKDTKSKDYLRFLEDFILFNNPDRIRWEKTEENIPKLPLRPGMTVADVGSGPGYFTFKFADIVGKEGRVYAIETNPRHLEFLRNYVEKYHVENVEVVTSSFEGIGLHPDVRVDAVYMCSLYHNVYAAFTDEERDLFVGSIRRALKPDGTFILVDNDMVEDDELPYHGPHVSRELLISQLYYYGFKLVEQFRFTVQRYVLIFKKQEEIPQGDLTRHAEFTDETQSRIKVTSSASLVRYRIIGTSTSGYTLNGKRMALALHDALSRQDNAMIARAGEAYKAAMSKERVGDDYTALLWFCQILTGEKPPETLEDPLYSDYYHFFADNDFDILKKYLRNKYDFATPLPDEDDSLVHDCVNGDVERGILNEWSEYLTFNNPNRCLWEKTEEMLDYLNLQKGEAVADIGCGSGYFSYRFSRLVGEEGRVYATETNEDALAYLRKLNERNNLRITTVVGRLNDACLPENSVDTIFMCSMYHAVYIASLEFVKDEFIESLKKALRPGGRLVIVDNDITARKAPPYFGPGIAKELIIAQLRYYGFQLTESRQFVPQRYMLIFHREQ